MPSSHGAEHYLFITTLLRGGKVIVKRIKNVGKASVFSLLALILIVFLVSPVYAKHQFLSWTPFPQQFQFTQTFTGANQPVTIGWGSIEYLSNDLVPGICPDGISDTISAVADVYIVPSGSDKDKSKT